MSNKYNKPVWKLNQPDDQYKTRPLPAPSGKYPYHLAADQFVTLNNKHLVFHMVGDTGSVRNPDFQRKVSEAMAGQYLSATNPEERPQFLYHLGDVVYNFGEATQYPAQFFAPYAQYPGPIFAIAGNHDSDVNPDAEVAYHSLDAFTAVFCDTIQQPVSFGGDTIRKSITQPNVYWTLETPLATIIGLHSNVPKYGFISDEQKRWFVDELIAADKHRPEKALILCLHHAPYSADTNHGSSFNMITFLEDVFEKAGVRPDVVFSGHVHNYQRFSKYYAEGKVVPFIVAGAGGYDELHSVALIDDERYSANDQLFEGIQLENFCDDRHGFLKIGLQRQQGGITLKGEYYTLPHDENADAVAVLTDRFTLNLG